MPKNSANKPDHDAPNFCPVCCWLRSSVNGAVVGGGLAMVPALTWQFLSQMESKKFNLASLLGTTLPWGFGASFGLFLSLASFGYAAPGNNLNSGWRAASCSALGGIVAVGSGLYLQPNKPSFGPCVLFTLLSGIFCGKYGFLFLPSIENFVLRKTKICEVWLPSGKSNDAK